MQAELLSYFFLVALPESLQIIPEHLSRRTKPDISAAGN